AETENSVQQFRFFRAENAEFRAGFPFFRAENAKLRGAFRIFRVENPRFRTAFRIFRAETENSVRHLAFSTQKIAKSVQFFRFSAQKMPNSAQHFAFTTRKPQNPCGISRIPRGKCQISRSIHFFCAAFQIFRAENTKCRPATLIALHLFKAQYESAAFSKAFAISIRRRTGRMASTASPQVRIHLAISYVPLLESSVPHDHRAISQASE